MRIPLDIISAATATATATAAAAAASAAATLTPPLKMEATCRSSSCWSWHLACLQENLSITEGKDIVTDFHIGIRDFAILRSLLCFSQALLLQY